MALLRLLAGIGLLLLAQGAKAAVESWNNCGGEF
jgi:hypothetical protein